MSCRLEEINTSVNAVVDQLGTVDSILLLEVGVVTSFNVIDDRFPTAKRMNMD